MPASQLADGVAAALGAYFLTREKREEGTLFLAPDPKRRGHFLRLLIAFEAWNDDEKEVPGTVHRAVRRAIAVLDEHGGDAVIREGPGGDLVIVRESALRA